MISKIMIWIKDFFTFLLSLDLVIIQPKKFTFDANDRKTFESTGEKKFLKT